MIPASTQAEGSHSLGDRAFDPGPVCVLLLPFLGVFLSPGLLDRLIFRLRAEGDPAAHVRLVVGASALLSELAGTAGGCREPCPDHGRPVLGAVFSPVAGGGAVGAGHLPVVPVDDEVGLGEAAAVLGLPAGGREDRAHQVNFVVPAGGDYFPGCRVAGVDQVLGGQQITLGEVVVDRDDHAHLLNGGVGRGDVRDQVRAVRLAGLSEVDLVAVPEVAAFHASPRVGVVRRHQPLRARRAVLQVPTTDLPVIDEVLLNPHLPQGMNPRKQAQGRRGVRPVQGCKQAQSVGADLLDQLGLLGLPFGQAGVFEPDRVPVEPLRRNPVRQPLRLAGGHAVQRGSQSLTEPYQSVDLPRGGQHDCGVRACTATGLE